MVAMFYVGRDWRFDHNVYQRTPMGDKTVLAGTSDWCGLAAELFNAKEDAQWLKAELAAEMLDVVCGPAALQSPEAVCQELLAKFNITRRTP